MIAQHEINTQNTGTSMIPWQCTVCEVCDLTVVSCPDLDPVCVMSVALNLSKYTGTECAFVVANLTYTHCSSNPSCRFVFP